MRRGGGVLLLTVGAAGVLFVDNQHSLLVLLGTDASHFQAVLPSIRCEALPATFAVDHGCPVTELSQDLVATGLAHDPNRLLVADQTEVRIRSFVTFSFSQTALLPWLYHRGEMSRLQ